MLINLAGGSFWSYRVNILASAPKGVDKGGGGARGASAPPGVYLKQLHACNSKKILMISIISDGQAQL